VIGAIGGGLLRDVILDRPISVLHVGTLYAVAAASGVGVLLILVRFGVPIPIAGIAATAVTTAVRVGAVVFDWRFPEQGSAPLFGRRGETPPKAPATPQE
jgi:uncharacterized membrane protein YeiH